VPSAFLIERDGGISRVIEGWSKRDMESLGGLAGAQYSGRAKTYPNGKPVEARELGSRAELQPTLK